MRGHRRCRHQTDSQGGGQQYDPVAYRTVLLRDCVAHRLIQQVKHLASNRLALGIERIAGLVEGGESATKLSLIVICEGAFDLAAHRVISRIIALEKLQPCVQSAQEHLVPEADRSEERRVGKECRSRWS